jgi:small subunit ribosomal protein S17
MGKTEKLQIGTVVANKMDKTVVVRIDRFKRHRLYGKNIRVTQRYKAHDEENACKLGDIVRISETRPLSREKRWRVVEVLQKGDVAEVAPREIGAHILEETREAGAAVAAARAAAEAEAREAARAAAAQAEPEPAAAETSPETSQPADAAPVPTAEDAPSEDAPADDDTAPAGATEDEAT